MERNKIDCSPPLTKSIRRYMELKKFQTKEEVDNYFAGDEIECLLCHKVLKAVGGKHLFLNHNITVEEYQIMFGLPHGHGLVCESSAQKMANAIKKRIENGDKTLTSLTPVLMNKAQHSLKRKVPPYRFNQMRQAAQVANQRKKEESRKRLLNIDGDKILAKIEELKCKRLGVFGKGLFLSDNDIWKKRHVDPAFREKYKAIMEKYKVKNILKNQVVELLKQGFTPYGIAKQLPISKTHIRRIQKFYNP